MPNRSMSIPNRAAHSHWPLKSAKDSREPTAREIIKHITCEMQVKIVYSEYGEETQRQAAVGVSTECFCESVGRSLVTAHHSRHDGARVTELQGIPGVLRRNRDQYTGRSPAEAGDVWNRHYGTRPGGRAKAD